jgi:hypothetical protein
MVNYNKVKTEGVEMIKKFWEDEVPLSTIYTAVPERLEILLSTFAEKVHKATLEEVRDE